MVAMVAWLLAVVTGTLEVDVEVVDSASLNSNLTVAFVVTGDWGALLTVVLPEVVLRSLGLFWELVGISQEWLESQLLTLLLEATFFWRKFRLLLANMPSQGDLRPASRRAN